MEQRVIADSPVESTTIGWDGERFWLLHERKRWEEVEVTILNPREMSDLVGFASPVLKEIQ